VWAAAVAVVVGVGVTAMSASTSRAADEDSPIATVMKKAFKGAGGRPGPGAAAGNKEKKPSLVQKAVEGKASPDEIKQLLGYCQELTKQKPPKGEQADWDTRTGKLVSAVELLSKGDKSGGPQLKAAANCKECHKLHKED
jgi:hypothetical protein